MGISACDKGAQWEGGLLQARHATGDGAATAVTRGVKADKEVCLAAGTQKSPLLEVLFNMQRSP